MICIYLNLLKLGAGNWGTAVASKLGAKLQSSKDARNEFSYVYDDTISLWVFDEQISGNIIFNKWCEVSSSSTNTTSLVDIINDTHENVKYLKGIKLTSNIRATSNLTSACDADVLVFVVPHEFLHQTLAKMKGHCKDTAVIISLTKGLHVTDAGPELITDIIARELGLKSIAVLMGANCAAEVAANYHCEATVASSDPKIANMVKYLFEDDRFRCRTSTDTATVELCGALKNIVAIGAGFCDALGYGCSSKAAIVRQGLYEIGSFCKLFYSTYDESVLLESCGVADLVATAFGGRNRRVSEEFARRIRGDNDKEITKDNLRSIWWQVEKDL